MGDKPHNAQDIEQIVRLRALLRRAVPWLERLEYADQELIDLIAEVKAND